MALDGPYPDHDIRVVRLDGGHNGGDVGCRVLTIGVEGHDRIGVPSHRGRNACRRRCSISPVDRMGDDSRSSALCGFPGEIYRAVIHYDHLVRHGKQRSDDISDRTLFVECWNDDNRTHTYPRSIYT